MHIIPAQFRKEEFNYIAYQKQNNLVKDLKRLNEAGADAAVNMRLEFTTERNISVKPFAKMDVANTKLELKLTEIKPDYTAVAVTVIPNMLLAYFFLISIVLGLGLISQYIYYGGDSVQLFFACFVLFILPFFYLYVGRKVKYQLRDRLVNQLHLKQAP